MKKVIVIGCPGAGKSVFSRELHRLTDLSLYHLDMLYWNADKTTVSKEIFRERLQRVLSEDNWIIDGNYGSTIEMRMKECDTVFFLDYPTDICIDGVKMRQGSVRPDMPWIETEDDAEFLEFIRNFQSESKPAILELLKNYDKKNIIIFKSREEADRYLCDIKSEN